jgi:hypothetical protein
VWPAATRIEGGNANSARSDACGSLRRSSFDTLGEVYVTSSITRTLALFGCAAVAAAVAAASAPAATAGSSLSTVTPPGHVYTCGWISEHQAAAFDAGVTCDPITFLEEMGQLPNLGPASGQNLGPLDYGGNIWVPCCGNYVGPGVYAWSDYVYSNFWAWQAMDNPSPTYEAYIQNTSGVNKYHRTFTNDTTWYCWDPSAASQRWGGHNIGTGRLHWYDNWAVVSQPVICNG